MKRFNCFVLVCFITLVLIVLGNQVFGAGTATVTNKGSQKHLIEYKWVWESDASGDVNSTGTSEAISGYIEQVEFVPSIASAYSPTDAYDVELHDSRDMDWLMGVGVDCARSATDYADNVRNPETDDGNKPILKGVTLEPSISNAGATRQGTIKMIIREYRAPKN